MIFAVPYLSTPIDTESQYLLTLTWNKHQYTWNILPQGYTESPTNVSQSLKSDLPDLTFPMGSTLVQYVDDLLLCSPSFEAYLTDNLHLLKSFADKGHKVSKEKLQFQISVKFLGHLLIPEGFNIDPSHFHFFPESKSKCKL